MSQIAMLNISSFFNISENIYKSNNGLRRFLLCYSMNYRDFSVKSKLIISLFKTVRLSLKISLFEK